MKNVKKIFVSLVKQLDLGSALAVRLVALTGKSEEPIHPKHFLSQKPWFAKYIKRSDVILDAGCGNGQNSIKAAKIAKRVIGVDAGKGLLAIAKSTSRRKKIKNVLFKIADLEKELEFSANSFDKVIFLDVLEHLTRRDLATREIKRLLKPNGLLFLGVPNSQTSWKRTQRKAGMCSYSDPDHKIEYSEDQIKKFLSKHKLEIINFGYGKFDTPLRGLFDIVGSISISAYKRITDWRQKKALENPRDASGFEIVARNIK